MFTVQQPAASSHRGPVSGACTSPRPEPRGRTTDTCGSAVGHCGLVAGSQPVTAHWRNPAAVVQTAHPSPGPSFSPFAEPHAPPQAWRPRHFANAGILDMEVSDAPPCSSTLPGPPETTSRRWQPTPPSTCSWPDPRERTRPPARRRQASSARRSHRCPGGTTRAHTRAPAPSAPGVGRQSTQDRAIAK